MSTDLKRILCPGGAGYIGSHVLLELLKTGKYIPVVMDNGHNSKAEACIKRVQEVAAKETGLAAKFGGSIPQIDLFQADLTDRASIDKIFESYKDNGGIWGVIHLAAWKAVGESGVLPLKYYENNVSGTLNLIHSMKDHGCQNFVYSSSATVYGEPKIIPIPESSPLQPESTYAKTKVFCEYILMDLAKADRELKICSLRYFNPGGAHSSGMIGEDPQGKPNNLLPLLAGIAVGRITDPLKVFGDDFPTVDGTCVRDYLHVVDLAKGHVSAIDAIVKGDIYEVEGKDKRGNYRAFNLGTGKAQSVKQIIEAMRKASGFDYQYEIAPRRDGDVPDLTADPTAAERELGWKSEKDLTTMCNDLWNWQSQNPQGY